MKRIANNILARVGLRVVRTEKLAEIIAERAHLRNELRTRSMQTVFGSRMYANPDDAGFQVYRLAGRSAAEVGGELAYIARNVLPGQIAVDVGANIGLITLLLARQVGVGGRVYAFEPGPVSFGLLTANIGFNRYDHVTARNLAISDTTGSTDLQVCLSGESDNRIGGIAVGNPNDYRKIPSQSTTLDDAIDRPVHFIKMDIQGAEYKALLGMRRTIERSAGLQMIMEYTPDVLPIPPREYLAFLRSLGFTIFDLPRGGVEQLADDAWLLSNIGGGARREMTNLLLKKAG